MRLTPFLIAAMLVSACTGPPTPPAPGPSATTDASDEASSEDPAEDATIADLEGTWKLIEIPAGTPVPEEIEITITFEGTQVSGSSGCNRYSGSIEEIAPGKLQPGLMSGTQRFCAGPVMEIEGAYLGALSSLKSYELLGPRLGLVYETEKDAEASLVFERVE